ncbi:MAG TPA: hypothetical protein DHV28_05900 [Ignavibacteriales bacterium]|nr:hypothetical protein [Ignavibacteriales bacterium]
MSTKKIKYYFFTLIAGLLITFQTLIAQQDIKGNLVTVQWLKKNINNPNIILLDASPSYVYKEKHISGAINYDIFSYGVQELPVAEIEKRYQAWGISKDKKIVMYDQGGTIFATRLFFSLDYYGFPQKDLLILDGGLAKWQAEGNEVTNEQITKVKKGNYTIKKINEAIKVELTEFLTASGDRHNNVLLEALDAGWHFGGTQFFNRPGHIPNAIMLPSDDFYNPDKTFKSSEEIKKMIDYLGIKSEQQIYTHCGGGIAASVPYFALKYLLGYPRVKLYNGSQLEWLSDQRELPFWTYDAPYLMRETNWLKTWGGKMMRMYGVSKVSIIDIRNKEEYNEGHLPFAINIPAEVFKNNITDLGKLAKELGSAGVNVSFEAVIMSGKGLTKEAALAFVMLEKLGQKKISIFMDSMEKAAQLGFPAIKDLNEISNSTGTYSINIQKDIIINDPKSTNGIYPKIYISSGEDMPVHTSNNKVIHLHYTEFLNDDGSIKAAKDIWNILDTAGVPRYAELFCISDDPGEAAVNFFILKMMGFPDIKVLVI